MWPCRCLLFFLLLKQPKKSALPTLALQVAVPSPRVLGVLGVLEVLGVLGGLEVLGVLGGLEVIGLRNL